MIFYLLEKHYADIVLLSVPYFLPENSLAEGSFLTEGSSLAEGSLLQSTVQERLIPIRLSIQ